MAALYLGLFASVSRFKTLQHMGVATRQHNDIARFQKDVLLPADLEETASGEHHVIYRFARRSRRMVQFPLAAEKAAQVERALQAGQLDQSVECIHG
jgi:hypothetical protein